MRQDRDGKTDADHNILCLRGQKMNPHSTSTIATTTARVYALCDRVDALDAHLSRQRPVDYERMALLRRTQDDVDTQGDRLIGAVEELLEVEALLEAPGAKEDAGLCQRRSVAARAVRSAIETFEALESRVGRLEAEAANAKPVASVSTESTAPVLSLLSRTATGRKALESMKTRGAVGEQR